MFENLEIPEYNLNIVNLNYILSEKIELDISNFLYSNNLKLNINSRDLKYIFKHFIILNILNSLKQEYHNIFIFNFSYNLKYLNNYYIEEDCNIILSEIIKKSSKIFKFIVFPIEKNFLIDKNIIYSFKKIIENKKKINYANAKKFCETNKLKEICSNLKNNTKIKELLHK
jgi:hypothetical protein